jgi:hypothetical protein
MSPTTGAASDPAVTEADMGVAEEQELDVASRSLAEMSSQATIFNQQPQARANGGTDASMPFGIWSRREDDDLAAAVTETLLRCFSRT